MQDSNLARDAQSAHWRETYRLNPDMYGIDPSEAGRAAIETFMSLGLRNVLELGAGQGRDTLAFLQAGLRVTALDYSADALAAIDDKAAQLGRDEQLHTIVHDVRLALPLEDSSVDAAYSHMLFNMALTKVELTFLANEVRRVLRPGGIHIYTVRHVGDAHFGQGIPRGEQMWENGGFIVHFFSSETVRDLSEGFSQAEVAAFEEGTLPRKLWRITQQKL